MATPNTAFDMADFVDFGETAMPDVSQEASLDVSAIPSKVNYLLDDSDILTQPIDAPTNTEFNTDFSSWLPRYQKPVQPCEYCRSKGLECFIYNSCGLKQSACSPCNALFRPCSFETPEKMPGMKQRTALDTLDVVAEDDCRHFGGLTGRKQMRSLGHMGPIEDFDEDDQVPKKGAAAARFPRAAVKALKDWMQTHVDHPYPTDEEKEALKQQTGLSIGQISNWMANTRRRQKARPKRSASPSIRPSTEAINIPVGRTWESLSTYTNSEFSRSHKTLASKTAGRFMIFHVGGGRPDPLERWKHSPPENEPAPMMAIAYAVETFDPPESTSLSSSYRKDISNGSTGSFSVVKAPSISSLETGFTNMSSGSLGSHNSAYSYGSRHSLGSMNSLKSKDRRRRRRLPTRVAKASLDEGVRLFHCTFCTDRFKSKYDWSRHEKSLHLSLEKWLCAPLGEIVVDKATGKPKCVYCDFLDPSSEHLATHNHSACYEKGPDSRTFYRKDHLRQHLRLIHGCKMTASMDSWRSEAQYIKSRCGFCGVNFSNWQDRIDHLAKEFRNGANMKNWRGCRGLDSHVAIHVTNAMPPYLIANESKSPFPFSASNSASLKQSNLTLESKDLEYLIPSLNPVSPTTDLFVAYQDGRDPSTIGPIILTTPKHYSASESPGVRPNSTCWEILTLQLGRFAREYIEKHGVSSLTDEMLQAESRRIQYGDPEDQWNQTSADNVEWLNLFKKAHGINSKAPVTGIKAHHEVYEDLGIHYTSAVDPSFNVNNFQCVTMPPNDTLYAQYILSGSVGETPQPRHSSPEHQSSYSLPGLSTPPASYAPATSATAEQLLEIYEPISELACPSGGDPCFGENGEMGFATQETGLPKKRYWLDKGLNAQMASVPLITEQQGDLVDECPTVGLPSFEPLNEQTCTEFHPADFQFPSWDQLPEALQDPLSSTDYEAMVPVGTTEVGMSDVECTSMPWDDAEMGFAMDMDIDLDLNLL
ncbi:hypothetical protein EJ02DRAFT_479592 [Clathrospora elynae]|uniref:Homeobox and C2H2 transcription factor n=1 Tax=Clathrospora elynae TaxID=706981 RepID=A0A6A5SY65_9PLEO|nr:hypothetical protein EJ02DRAFT_479592 [Clathrospora elynae]